MLKRLRLQFVAVIMVIVTIMLCTVFGMLYFFTREQPEQESFAMMRAVPVGIMAPDRPLAPLHARVNNRAGPSAPFCGAGGGGRNTDCCRCGIL